MQGRLGGPGWTTALLLLAVALVGLAHLALLPPFEGFDESAHLSYVQELADTGHPPRYGVDGLSRDTDLYSGPVAYSGSAPFDQTGRATYRSYRQAGAPPIGPALTRYAGDAADNWQAQHPPLYYALMVPVYRLAKGAGWVNLFLALRLASWALACSGFALGVVGSWRLAGRFGAWTTPIMAAWPFLVPQFFPEFARMGNDSLCLLCVGAAWACLAPLLTGEGGWLAALGLGLALGCGLLTKAFFLPIGAGVGVLLLLRWWSVGRRPAVLAQAVVAGLIALAIGGWWYVEKKLETGSLTGSDEFIRLAKAGGAKLMVENFEPLEFIRGLAVIAGTFLWAGTWSMARLPLIPLVAPALIVLAAGLAYVRRLLRDRLPLIAWAPLALAAPMLGGLVYHVFVWMAGTSAETPGWYLHILAAPLGLALAIGWRQPRLLAGLTAACVLTTALSWALQLSMWSGCAAKLGADKSYSFAGAGCFIDTHVLARLGHPALGALALAGGVAAALVAAWTAWRAFQPERGAEPTALGAAAGLKPF